jgi:hypothetical protein
LETRLRHDVPILGPDWLTRQLGPGRPRYGLFHPKLGAALEVFDRLRAAGSSWPEAETMAAEAVGVTARTLRRWRARARPPAWLVELNRRDPYALAVNARAAMDWDPAYEAE